MAKDGNLPGARDERIAMAREALRRAVETMRREERPVRTHGQAASSEEGSSDEGAFGRGTSAGQGTSASH